MIAFVLLLVAFATCCCAGAPHGLETLLVSSYNDGNETSGFVRALRAAKISHDSWDLTTVFSDPTSCGRSPSWLTLDEKRGILYCLDEGLDTPNGSINTFKITRGRHGKIEPADNKETVSGPVSAVLYGPKHKQFLVAAHYTGSAVTTWETKKDGGIEYGEVFDFEMDAPGPDPDRQDAPHPHQAILDPTGKFILIPDLGADLVRVYSFDGKTGDLTAQSPLVAKPGSGPRHGAFFTWKSKQCKKRCTNFYLVSELENTVTTYSVAYGKGGNLTFTETAVISTFGDGPTPDGAAAAEILVSVRASTKLYEIILTCFSRITASSPCQTATTHLLPFPKEQTSNSSRTRWQPFPSRATAVSSLKTWRLQLAASRAPFHSTRRGTWSLLHTNTANPSSFLTATQSPVSLEVSLPG